MRIALLLLSCVNVVVLGVDEILYGLLDLTKQPQFNQIDQIIKSFALVSLFISLVLLAIYIIRQAVAQERQLKKQGRKKIFSGNILRTTSPKTRPYRREAYLQKALFMGLTIAGLFRPVAYLMFPYATAPFKPVTLLDWAGILGMSLCLLIYAILSSDLTKGNSVNSGKRRNQGKRESVSELHMHKARSGLEL